MANRLNPNEAPRGLINRAPGCVYGLAEGVLEAVPQPLAISRLPSAKAAAVPRGPKSEVRHQPVLLVSTLLQYFRSSIPNILWG